MEDDDLPPDLLRLVAQDEKQILPQQEITEAINLGIKKKEEKWRSGPHYHLPSKKDW